MSQLWIPRGAQMYVMCLNVSHVSKLARYAREFQQEGPMGQETEPWTGESHDKSCPKMTKMANERTLQQGNSRWKVPKNDENRRKRVKSAGAPRSTRKPGARLTPVRRRTLHQLSHSYPKVYPRITNENTHKTHRVTESTRDIILTKISGRLN